MAVNIYESTSNPVTGETFKALSFNKDALTMQWTVHPKGYVAFEHIHYNQDEIFYVKRGELKLVMGGKEHIIKQGESITVPKGIAHLASNNKEEILNCVVEYKPGLDQDTFMQCFNGLVKDGFIDKKGGISIPKMGYFLMKMKAQCMTRPTEIPAPLFKIALRVFYLRGMLSGWKKYYYKYTQN